MPIIDTLKNLTKLADVPENACPFSWTDVTLTRGCLGAILGTIPIIGYFFKEPTVYIPVPCIGQKCKLWDSKNNNCVLNNLSRA
ncbi:MAG: hypothetical protein HZA14_13100 [Nitrospirae bacterium]|nr:hypothetical protein [Nitrospirota bacterium]